MFFLCSKIAEIFTILVLNFETVKHFQTDFIDIVRRFRHRQRRSVTYLTRDFKTNGFFPVDERFGAFDRSS